MRSQSRLGIQWTALRVVAMIVLLVVLLPHDVRGGKYWRSPAWTAEIVVSSVAEFQDALASVKEDQAISLRPGIYEELIIADRRGGNPVVVRSLDRDNPAQVGVLRVSNSQRLWFENILFAPVDANRRQAGPLVDIRDSWAIGMAGNRFEGSAEGPVVGDPAGVRVLRTDDFLFAENRLGNLGRGLVVGNVRKARISRNRFSGLRGDGGSFAGVQDVVIEGNFFGGFNPPASGRLSFIRFWQQASVLAGTANVAIRGNLLLQGGPLPIQGISVGSEAHGRPYRNFTIENNVISVSDPRGISIYDMIDARISGNSLIPYAGSKHSPRISLARTQRIDGDANVADGVIRKHPDGTTLSRDILAAGRHRGTDHLPASRP